MKIIYPILACLLLPSVAWAQSSTPPKKSALVRAMQDELDRTMKELKLANYEAPYYASFSVYEVDKISCDAQDGGLLSSNRTKRRWLRVNIRVGDYSFDNGNALFANQFSRYGGMSSLPLEDHYQALRRHIWVATDAAYKEGVEVLEKKRAVLNSLSNERTDVPSFARVKPLTYVSNKTLPKLDDVDCDELVQAVSKVYADDGEVETGRVWAGASNVRRYFIDSEGAFVNEPISAAHIDAWARATASDGMPVNHHFDHVRRAFDDLPTQEELVEEAKASAKLLGRLRKAEKVDGYSGPVLFADTAASQLMWRAFAAKASGTPAPVTDIKGLSRPSSTLVSRLGRRILPKGFDIVDDPSVRKLGSTPLMGAYAVDDEGVRAEKVQLIKDGMLRSLLMSRTPIEKIASSNGHGRAGWGRIEAAPGNLLIEASGGQDEEALKKMLIAEAKDEGLSYGYIVRQLDNPNAMGDPLASRSRRSGDKIGAQVVVRVNVDGSEELVRGLELDMPRIRDLEHITAWGKDSHLINYVSSAPNGMMQSIATPALLFEEVDMPAGERRFRKGFILEAPKK